MAAFGPKLDAEILLFAAVNSPQSAIGGLMQHKKKPAEAGQSGRCCLILRVSRFGSVLVSNSIVDCVATLSLVMSGLKRIGRSVNLPLDRLIAPILFGLALVVPVMWPEATKMTPHVTPFLAGSPILVLPVAAAACRLITFSQR